MDQLSERDRIGAVFAAAWDLLNENPQVPDGGAAAAALESKGWRAWYAEIFGRPFVDALGDHHIEAIEWHWDAAIAKREGRPFDYDAYIAAWSRGHMKSTIARRIAVADACLSRRGYCLYVSGTKEKVKGHALSLETLLASDKIRHWYPQLAQVKKSAQGESKGWTRHFIYTEQGYVFHFISLEEGVAGANVDNLRPTLIIPDDIDDRKDSPVVTEKRYRVFTREVLPTKQADTLFFLAQNVISSFSIMHRILTQRARILTNRRPTEPIPAIRNLQTEERTVNGIAKDVVIDGEPTWHLYGLDRAQEDIDTYGLDSFMAENQHDVTIRLTGAVFGEWNELYHVITWSEFVRFFGREACGCQIEHDPDIPCHNPHIPFAWNLGRGLDWGTTPGHPCVTVWAARPAERHRLNDSVFVYRELCRPYFPLTAQKPYLVNPRRIAQEILAAERRWEETGRITMSILSHEASATQNTFLDPDEPEFNRLRFVKHQAKNRMAGVPQIQNALQINHNEPHPFRRHPVTGETLMGRPRFYLIVADGQGELFESGGRWLVRPAIDERGFARLRYEFPLYHYPQTQDGSERPLPLKRDDDAIDATKHLANVFFPRRRPKTREELIEEQLPPNYRMEHLQQASPDEWDALYANRQAAVKEIKRRQSPRRNLFYDDDDESGRLTKADLDMI